jgi:hypothetical protein
MLLPGMEPQKLATWFKPPDPAIPDACVYVDFFFLTQLPKFSLMWLVLMVTHQHLFSFHSLATGS